MRRWLPLVTVCLGTFMLLIDATIVNVALPDVARDLKTSFGSLQWVVNAYALVMASLVLGAGSIADLVGHRRAYVAGLGLFAGSSLVCGLATNAPTLIAARAVQGIGAAAMLATTFALLNSNYHDPRDRGTAYGLWGAVAGASGAVGPIIGGALTEAASWRWVFFVNLPVSVLAVALCLVILDDVHEPYAGRVDLGGLATFTAAAASLTYGLIRANGHGWSSPASWAWLIAAPAFLAAFVAVELRSDHAMLDLGLLRRRSFVGVLVGGMLLFAAAFGALTYVSIWLQSVLGLSPVQAGLVLLPMSAASFGASALVGRVLRHLTPERVLATGLALAGAGGLLGAALLHGAASWPAVIPGLVLVGLGVGLTTPTLSSAAMSAVPAQRGGMAGGTLNTAQELGFTLGTATLGSVFAARAAHLLNGHRVGSATEVSRGLAGGQRDALLSTAPASARPSLDHALHVAALGGMQWIALTSGAVGLLAAAWVLVALRRGGDATPSGRPAEVSRPPEPAASRAGRPGP